MNDMIDWKIIAASIVALLFVASLFIGGLGIRDFLSGGVEKISEYLGGSPFGGVVSTQKGEKEISFLISPSEITIKPDAEVSLEAEQTRFSGFKGEILLSFSNSTVDLRSSSLSINFPLKNLNISSLALSTFSLQRTKLEIKPNISTDSGDLEMKGFMGSAIATSKGLEFRGKVSQLKVTIGDLSFQLV